MLASHDNTQVTGSTTEVSTPPLKEPDLRFAPGCFGHAFTLRSDAEECLGCPFASRCEPESSQRTARVLSEPLPVELRRKIEALRARKRKNKAAERTRKRALKPPASESARVVLPPLTREEFNSRALALKLWSETANTAFSRQIKRRWKTVAFEWAAFEHLRRINGREPTLGELADVLEKRSGAPCSQSMAQKRRDLFKRLEEPNGPWGIRTEKTLHGASMNTML
jgi:hypothetical protein